MLDSPSMIKEGQAESSAESESDLVRSVAAGDQAAYRSLVTRYRNPIFSLVLRQVANHSIAEELAQEIFVKAYVHIKKFRFESSFSTWLVRIALNHTNSYFASRRYKQACRTDEFVPEVHSGGAESPEAHFERKERMLQFRQALARLSPKLRDVVTLCGLEGRGYEETAEILRIPVGTVRSRLNKARLELKQRFEGGLEQGGIDGR